MTDLSGLRAVVTGGASGIGLATARALAGRGAAVAVLDLDPAAVSEPLLGLRADVTDDASAVSYTNLQAPTNHSVEIFAAAAAFKKKKESRQV
mgnify:CR=1 FL=1